MRRFYIFVVEIIFFSFCLCELSIQKKDKFLNTFIDYLNNVPNQPYSYEDGLLISAQRSDDDSSKFKIVAKLKVSEIHDIDAVKSLQCAGWVTEGATDDDSVKVQDDYHCMELQENPSQLFGELEDFVTDNPNISTEATMRRPVQLDNEVQPNTGVTSGEQFIAIPREQPAPCIGCATHVDTHAAGVTELAELGVKHLDRHEPNVQHTLRTVHDVERQVQVVNGVRYILILTVEYNNCTATETEACTFNVPCKISILEKPWMKLPDGSKYRAIVANNCTEEWQFGDNGEVITQNSNNNKESNEINVNPNNTVDNTDDGQKPQPDYDKIANTGSVDDVVKVVHNSDLQSQQNQDRILTDEELKTLQEQIIPHTQFNEPPKEKEQECFMNCEHNTEEAKATAEHVEKVETKKHFNANSVPIKKPEVNENTGSLSDDKKKVIDDMMNFFNFAAFDSKPITDENHRLKRSYRTDLKIMNLAEKYQKLKKYMYNAKYLYALGQTMVDYLNEMDMEVKSRTLKDIIAAEEEFENHQHFFYIQARVTIPCDKAECNNKDSEMKICNGVIDNSNPQSPQVLNSFCHNEEKKETKFGTIKDIALNDKVLILLVRDAVKKIETASPYPYAMRIMKILHANTQKVSGTLTKMSLILENINCKKTVPFALRNNCTTVQELGSQVCDIEFHERQWLKNKKVTYTCTQRPIGESFIDNKERKDNVVNITDPKVMEIAQQALQYLEIQSNRNNKQKIVEIKTVSTQVVAGLLINVEFVVGYTDCKNDFENDISTCKLLEKEQLRQCKAQVWERPWLEERRQVKVSCNDSENNANSNSILKLRKKKSVDLNFVGGPLKQDTNNAKYLTLAEESLHQYLQMSGNMQYHKVVQIEKVTTQVVAGSLTNIDFKVAPTTCLVDAFGQPSSSNCEVSNSSYIFSCHSSVWERPWLNKKEMTVNCTDSENKKKSRTKRQLLGGPTKQNSQDSKYKELAEESLRHYFQTSGITQHHTVVRVTKVDTQVVSGSLTRIDFKISPTNCQLDSKGKPTSSDCEVSRSADVYNCHSKVWEQPWLNKKEFSVNCKIDSQKLREKRQIPGEETEQNPNDSQYRVLAEESLQQYLQTSVNKQSHKVVQVVRVVTQPVSGRLTKIDFKVSPEGQNSADVYDCHSEVWEQSWLNKKEITVNCNVDGQKSRVKRQIPGGETEQNPNDSQYRVLAEESLQQYLQTSGNKQPHKVVQVVRVVTQPVSGRLTKIDFKVKPQDQNSVDVYDCHSEVWEQSWLNKKEITVNCNVDGQKSRVKRQIPGGETEQNPNDSQYRVLAEESLQQYLQTSGNKQPHKVVQVVRVVTQPVSGRLTKIDFKVKPQDQNSVDVYDCHSEVWEQSWLNKKEMTVNCNVEGQKSRVKRQIPGGETEQNPNDSQYRVLAEESLQQYLQTSGNKQPHKVVQVVRVVTQPVSGRLTKIDFKVSPEGQNSADVYDCHSEVWEQSWLNKKEITVNCNVDGQKSRVRRQIPGREKERNPNDSQYRVLAEESLQQYLQTSGNKQPHKIVQVVRVVTQSVSGRLTKIDFKVKPQDQNSVDVYDCHSEVWEQSWLNKKEINVNCNVDGQKSRVKRQIPGGETEQNPNDSQYRVLAEESLQQYLQTSGNTQHHSVVQVDQVITQVVAGSLTKIDFKVSPTNCQLDSNGQTSSSKCEVKNLADVYNCHSEVWERPWLNKTEITVNCTLNNQMTRSKRYVITGRITEENAKDEEFKLLAEESLQQYMLTTGIKRFHKLVEVESVRSQVISGKLTRLDFKISPTNCEIDDFSKNLLTDCDVLAAEVFDCHSEVWERPWLKNNNSKVIDVTCNILDGETPKYVGGFEDGIDNGIDTLSVVANNRSKRNTYRTVKSGGAREQDPSKIEYRKLAEDSLRKYVRSQKSQVYHEVVEVRRVLTKVVQGVLYNIDYIASPTTCSTNALDKASCERDETVVLYCHTEIWNRPWLKRKEIKVACNLDESGEEENFKDTNKDKKKRSLGGPQKMDIEKSILLAEQVVRKYQRDSDSDYIYKVTKIHNAEERVVRGIIKTIDFSISPTTCYTGADNEELDQCPLKQPKVTLRCRATVQEFLPSIVPDIRVTCKNKPKKKKKVDQPRKKRDELKAVRIKRQTGSDDDDIEDETKYYYADRAISAFNSVADTNNLFKIVSIHDVQRSVQMNTLMVRMYVEIAMTYCMRHSEEHELHECDEIEGLHHKLCLARIWPSPDDEMIVHSANMICHDDVKFESVSGLSTRELLKASIAEIEKSPNVHYKILHQGEPNVVPSLNYRIPTRLNFIAVSTNCTKDVDIEKHPFECFEDDSRPVRVCTSYIYMLPNSKSIHHIDASCRKPHGMRRRRSISLDPTNATVDELMIQKLVQESLEHLERASIHRYKQRVLLINSYSSKITTGKQTTIDFDVGYTNCLKYEWIENITSCEFIEHLPRRHCVSQVFERLWIDNGRNIEVSCEDDETPLEAHIEFESAENAMHLAKEALKHVEVKYPSPRKQKVVRIFSLEKQAIAGLHYRLKMEVGFTDCMALSVDDNCKLVSSLGLNKFCRVHVWLRPWTDHPPSYRVSCDYQEGASAEIYHQIQAEALFHDFLTTYKPEYMNDATQIRRRFEIFRANVRKIHELNIYERGTARYAVTRFTDLSYDEFSQMFLGLKPSLQIANQVPMRMADIPKVELVEKFDWRDFDAVTEVKDQGSCGSCWAFSVTGNIEGQWKMQSGKLVSLSEQELVDCDTLDHGCNGGLPDNAYRAIEQLGGLELETDYPYEGEDDKCSFNKSLARVQISGAVNISSNETDMAKWLVQNGPISIGINANAMQFYVGGVSHPWKMLCNPTNLDHGVLIVGYGVKDYPLFHKRLPYWIVKNSWGKSWGEQGYYRVYRGDGTCGVNKMVSSALIYT